MLLSSLVFLCTRTTSAVLHFYIRQCRVMSDALAGPSSLPPRSGDCGGPSCCPPLWPVRSGHLNGRSDLGLAGEVLHIPERKENMLQLPGLVVEVLRVPGVEVADGGEELPGAHSDASGPA